ncbi:helicase [Rhizobium sp. RU36D]|uniref:helicase n=1 Tax=Rhizobium sp. RU36D TaxID=1907415 RepID=UPI0009D80CC7|nr:helicase [Rhizobium sp. RU36D]SMD18573.1 Superfamily II DNA or RNA helicase [Rhizobium sp. RU36D]
MTVNPSYQAFLDAKRIMDPATGISGTIDLPDYLFPHQRDIVKWALRRGRAAVFAGTGLGKTLIELTWSHRVADYTGKPVLLLAPLAVSHQHEREAGTFGIAASVVSARGSGAIDISNYQKLDRFDLSQFGGVALDESSILKNVDGHYRTRLIDECSRIPFRLAATATPAPNDFMELGNHAEFLGVMRYTDMLATFFVHDGGDTRSWRLKGHAEDAFWRWMATWAVMLRKPSDLGYSDEGYDLPPLHYHHHQVAADYAPCFETGTLFPMQAKSLSERLAVRRDSVDARVALAASLTPRDQPHVWWCNLNSEADGLARAIPGAVNLSGADSDAEKERKLKAFSRGEIGTLITKASLTGFGMNWQHCRSTGFVGLNDSWEQIYQALRRFWRFGQTKPVHAHFISDEREGNVVANFRRKDADAERMAEAMVRHMADLSAENVRGLTRDIPDYRPDQPMTIPSWIGDAA